jgi:hypothetical protein
MDLKGTGSEVRVFLRSFYNAFDDLRASNPGKRYNMTFALGFHTPDIDKTDSEVCSRLSSLMEVVQKFASTDSLQIKLDVVESGGIDAQLFEKTKQNFEAASKLQEATKAGQDATQAAQSKIIEASSKKSG